MAFILTIEEHSPHMAADVFLAPTAVVIGDVTLAEGVSIWYGAVLRGDAGRIAIGARSNVQDNAVIHVNAAHPTVIEAEVTIGHGAVLEGCLVEMGALIGMHATVLSGARVGAGALVAAGALVREGMHVPAGHLAAGVPARVIGPLAAEQRARMAQAPVEYLRYAALHRRAISDR